MLRWFSQDCRVIILSLKLLSSLPWDILTWCNYPVVYITFCDTYFLKSPSIRNVLIGHFSSVFMILSSLWGGGKEIFILIYNVMNWCTLSLFCELCPLICRFLKIDAQNKLSWIWQVWFIKWMSVKCSCHSLHILAF